MLLRTCFARPQLTHEQGNINPDVPPLTEKRNVFNTNTHGEAQEVPSPSSETGNEKDLDKVGHTYVGEMEEVDFEKPGQEAPEADPFTPFDDLPEERHFIVTIRAILVGVVCGALVNASNVYLGLKTGWTFGASLFGAIIGFAVLKYVVSTISSHSRKC